MGWFSGMHGGDSDYELHYLRLALSMPTKWGMSTCAGFGCHLQQKYELRTTDRQAMQAMFQGVEDAEQERYAIRRYLNYIHGVVAAHSKNERAIIVMQLDGEAERSLDTATNITSYLLMLDAHDLLKFHHVLAPAEVWGIFKVSHWRAVILDVGTKERWFVWDLDNEYGDLPEIKFERDVL